jgi:hypothetical protein
MPEKEHYLLVSMDTPEAPAGVRFLAALMERSTVTVTEYYSAAETADAMVVVKVG